MINITSWGENTEENILAFEEQIGFALPADYRHFLLANNGGIINNQTFFVKGLEQEVSMNVLYGLTNPRAESLTLGYWVKEYEGEVQANELVIGNDPGSHQILYITAGEDKGIYYWDTNHFFAQSSEAEGDTYFLAESFAGFCQLLTDYRPNQLQNLIP